MHDAIPPRSSGNESPDHLIAVNLRVLPSRVMELVDEDAHAALAYVDAMARQGYRLSVSEFEAYATARSRRVSASPLLSNLWLVGSTFAGKPEPIVDWLSRLGWIKADGRRRAVTLTELGRAVLRELEQREISSETPLEVTLSPEDPIAYARAIERIASHDKALLVDPYFRLDDLLPVAMNTGVTRLLTSERGNDGRKRVGAIGVGVQRLSLEHPFEVRVTDSIHDRFVIPATGPVDSLGISIGGIGRRLSVMVRIGSPVADTIREEHERAWEAASKLVPESDESPSAPTPRRRRKPTQKPRPTPGSKTA